MTKAFQPTTSIVEYEDENGKMTSIVVTTQGYEDGRIHRQYGEGEVWSLIKEADEIAEMVGTCVDCQKPIYEDGYWFVSIDEQFIQHGFVEDCGEVGYRLQKKIKKSDCHGKCDVCGNYIHPEEEYKLNDQNNIVHKLAGECGK